MCSSEKIFSLLKRKKNTEKSERNLKSTEKYVSNRKQCTSVNGVDSSIQETKIFVPQGPCLGPLLFLSYINDLPRTVQNSRMSMFADDMCLYHQSSNISQLMRPSMKILRMLITS